MTLADAHDMISPGGAMVTAALIIVAYLCVPRRFKM